MRYCKFFLLCLLGIGIGFYRPAQAGEVDNALFSTRESKLRFAKEVSVIIEETWKEWQDSVRVDDVDVEGSQGFLQPGDMAKPVLTFSATMRSFNRKDKSQDYINCVKAVLGAVENGMRAWQRGYTHKNIPFPRGGSCTFTMPPSNNVPVTVGSGRSLGDKMMTEDALYTYMLYRVPRKEDNTLIVFRASAKAISECFKNWEDSCFITGIAASGGIAPQPAPMGSGPGPVRGARGNNGKLAGAYFDSSLMQAKMAEYFNKS